MTENSPDLKDKMAPEENFEEYEDLFLEKIKKEYKDGWSEENWEEVRK